MTLYAALTGDIVNSSALTSGQLRDVIQKISRIWSGENGSIFSSPWEQNLHAGICAFSAQAGDGWQLIARDRRLALRLALGIRALCHIEGVETRISIANGTLDETLPADLNTIQAPLLVASGRALKKLDTNPLMTHCDGGAIEAATLLLDNISQDWTRAQSQAINLALDPRSLTNIQIAKELGKSRQAVEQALKAASFPAVEKALALIESDGDA